MQTNSVSVVIFAAFAIAYSALSWAGTPHVVDDFPDSHTYLPISFLGHADRLWTIPVIYFVGSSSVGRVALQTCIGLACWITFAIQVGRVINMRGNSLGVPGVCAVVSADGSGHSVESRCVE